MNAICPDDWSLDPKIAFLNHGSFGACPTVVLEKQQRLRDAMERQPVDFFVRKLTPLLDESRDALAGVIGADPADVVFVSNATAGVNSVLRSIDFRPGDEILVTNHDYNACRNVVRYVAERTGATIVEATIPLPIDRPQQIVDAVIERVTNRTRLALLDHITSPTAIVFPIEDLARELDRRGIDTLVDGAHAPGMVALDVRRLSAAYYTGNCHKWLCSPKGAGFLHVRRDRQAGIQPPIVSHGWNRPRVGHSAFQDAFDWPGTIDPTAWLCVGEAIRFVSTLAEGGLRELMDRNRALAAFAQRSLCERLPVEPVAAESMIGSMAAVQLPDDETLPCGQGASSAVADDRLHDALRDQFQIEVPVYYWPDRPKKLLRVSAQAYNHCQQYERLADALGSLLDAPKRMVK